MKQHVLIVEDQQDVFENLNAKITKQHPHFLLKIADNCDDAYKYIRINQVSDPVTLLIVDLTFKWLKPNAMLKTGKSLLRALKEQELNIPIIIYSSHDEMEHIHPIISNYSPNGYVIKSNTSTNELLFAISEVLNDKRYFSQLIYEMQKQRLIYTVNIDSIDEKIIELLPQINAIDDWNGKIYKDNTPLSYKSIKKRIDNLCISLEVENQKQLLLKLQKLAIL